MSEMNGVEKVSASLRYNRLLTLDRQTVFFAEFDFLWFEMIYFREQNHHQEWEGS